MKVLVACEYSGRVRDAFAAKGHDAWSCDILPTESPGQHIQGDIMEHLNEGWDLMVAHPPCTYLSNAGAGWFNEEKYGDKARERKRLRQEAFEFVMKLAEAPIDKIAIENPVGWLNSHWRKPDQIINPFQFGDPHKKRTCLWLKNLPLLEETNVVEPLIMGYYKSGPKKGKKMFFTDSIRNPHVRSLTFQGIADAMADQWGS